MSISDNMIIFDITIQSTEPSIPDMSRIQLKDIIFRQMKLNKACDIYKLTVEHLRILSDNSLIRSSIVY